MTSVGACVVPHVRERDTHVSKDYRTGSKQCNIFRAISSIYFFPKEKKKKERKESSFAFQELAFAAFLGGDQPACL